VQVFEVNPAEEEEEEPRGHGLQKSDPALME